MRKILDRLRRWLIKKLGGYTEQFTPVRKEITRLPDAKAKKVQIQIIESRQALERHIDIGEYLKRREIESVAQFLEENGYIKWERTSDIEKCAVIFRATLWVVSAEELEPRHEAWVETHGD